MPRHRPVPVPVHRGPPSTPTSSSVLIIAVARACYHASWRFDEGKQTRRRSLTKRAIASLATKARKRDAAMARPLLPAALPPAALPPGAGETLTLCLHRSKRPRR